MKLRRTHNQQQQPYGWTHYCPGCKSEHVIPVESPGYSEQVKWQFDGNEELPTFTPSVRLYTTRGKWEGEKWIRGVEEHTICHYNITAGQIIFHGDSEHELKGTTVPLPDLPPEDKKPAKRVKRLGRKVTAKPKARKK